jgi:DNA-binding transcriptional ArsR family regulator
MRGTEGLDELLLALFYRDGPLTVDEIAQRAKMDRDELEATLGRLLAAGRIDRLERDDMTRYQASSLVIPLGASAGWEAAIFDHFKALVTTIICRLRDDRETTAMSDRVGGSTYTIDVWVGHPLADEVYESLERIRAQLSNLRERVEAFNGEHEIPENNTRVVIYAGQCLIGESNGQTNHDE